MKSKFNRESLSRKVEYPVRYCTGTLINTVSILFVVIFVFLVLYKPFGVYAPELKFNYLIICGFHALCPSVLVFIYFSILNAVRKKRPLSEWTNLKEYLHVSAVFLLVGIASFLMRDMIYTNPDNWSLHYAWEEIRNCYLAGILFYGFSIITNNYRRPHQINITAESSNMVSITPESMPDNKAEIFIKTNVKADDFSFYPDDLLFAKAEGNYIELTLFRNNLLSTELKRISLSQFELQVADCPLFFRCHRAYVVNMKQIKKASGNSQGYQLSFEVTEKEVPVSRAQIAGFDHYHIQRSALQ